MGVKHLHVTFPKELLMEIDELAGYRGRSKFIREALQRRCDDVRQDHRIHPIDKDAESVAALVRDRS
jgi:metal-responsive CopG/Arc/MetJ family transcriptional regulator